MKRISFREFLLEVKERKNVLQKIHEEGKSLLDHIIKILKWDDEYNKINHMTDIDGWYRTILKILNQSNVKIKKEAILNEIFLKHVPNIKALNKIIKRMSPQYNKLMVLNNDEDVYNILVDLYDDICLNLEKGVEIKIRNLL